MRCILRGRCGSRIGRSRNGNTGRHGNEFVRLSSYFSSFFFFLIRWGFFFFLRCRDFFGGEGTKERGPWGKALTNTEFEFWIRNAEKEIFKNKKPRGFCNGYIHAITSEFYYVDR